MKLSVIILCWNDLKVIEDCLRSIYSSTRSLELEVIVSDNGSTDGSIDFIIKNFPQVRLIQNGRNLRFAKGNNVGIHASQGEYALILNPDTIIHEGALETMVAFADQHPEAGAFGCRVLNADGTYQGCIWPFPTPGSEWRRALGLRSLAYLSEAFHPGAYVTWKGETERAVGYPAGCCLLIRNNLLKKLGGFDEQFFYYYEETDLCRRIWDAGYPILYTPKASITHLGGQSTHKKFPPIGFAIDRQVTRYLYFYKYYGERGVRSSRRSILAGLLLRRFAARLSYMARPSDAGKQNLEFLRTLFAWNLRVDPVRLAKNGEEPELHVKPLGRVLER
ncbi:MAG TPA: glycosyltransferase family 2 protein [Terriglobales bacterium]|nr:glycosyltransferase family 2 protein [Terriglobales bacterium]